MLFEFCDGADGRLSMLAALRRRDFLDDGFCFGVSLGDGLLGRREVLEGTGMDDFGGFGGEALGAGARFGVLSGSGRDRAFRAWLRAACTGLALSPAGSSCAA